MASLLALAGVTLAAAFGAQAALPAPARVSFPSVDRDAAGNPVTISALYFRPPQAAPGAAVAFYPGCVVSLRQGARWLPAVPLSLHVAELDDWTPAGACVRLGDFARARGAAMDVTVHAGAHHGFDAPSGEVRLWKEVTSGANPDRGVHVGPDPAARAAAVDAVRAFLRERLAAPEQR